MNDDIRDEAHAKQLLRSINPMFLEAMSQQNMDDFVKFKKKNVAKTCYVDQYYHGSNLILLGDAAHPFRPIGQGINVAMLDGVWLCNAIATFPHDIGKALRKHGDYSKM